VLWRPRGSGCGERRGGGRRGGGRRGGGRRGGGRQSGGRGRSCAGKRSDGGGRGVSAAPGDGRGGRRVAERAHPAQGGGRSRCELAGGSCGVGVGVASCGAACGTVFGVGRGGRGATVGRAGAALQRCGPAAAASASTEAAQARRHEAAGISSFGSARSHQFLRVGDPVSVYLLPLAAKYVRCLPSPDESDSSRPERVTSCRVPGTSRPLLTCLRDVPQVRAPHCLNWFARPRRGFQLRSPMLSPRRFSRAENIKTQSKVKSSEQRGIRAAILDQCHRVSKGPSRHLTSRASLRPRASRPRRQTAALSHAGTRHSSRT